MLREFGKFILIYGFMFTYAAASEKWPSEKWIRLGESELFYDAASLQRSGELVTVILKRGGKEPGIGSGYSELEIDCVKKVVYFGHDKRDVGKESAIGDLMAKACTPRWQFWK